MSAFIDMHRGQLGVEPICTELDVSASATISAQPASGPPGRVADERLTGRIRDVHAKNYECYGYRRVHAQLVREGERAGRDQVARLMRSAGIEGRERPRPQTTLPQPPPGSRCAHRARHRLKTGSSPRQ